MDRTRPPVLPAFSRCAWLPVLWLALAAAPAFGWSEPGHRVVGELAAGALTPAARAEVDALLAGEPEPTLAGVSAWPDRIRDQPEWEHTGPWHYLNFPRGVGCEFDAGRDCRNGSCVVGAIEQQLAVLADRGQPRERRRDALKFVVHFVGDVHQPLHAGFADDKGGNDFQVNLRLPGREPEGTNLHAVWDRHLLFADSQDWRAHARRLARDGLVSSERDAVHPRPAAGWAEESCRILREPGAYPEKHVVGADYFDTWRPTAEKRLREAGARLAALLNDSLGQRAD